MGGLATTFKVLGGTRNEAAMTVLAAALDAPQAGIREQALAGILARPGVEGPRELVTRWHTLPEQWQQRIAARPGRLSSAARDAILGTEPQLRANGCAVVIAVREFDLVPALINAAEEEGNPSAKLAAETVLALSDLLYEELAAPRDYSKRRDPQLLRQFVVGSLELSLSRFARHKRRELVESFLVLANREHATLKRVLQDPHNAVFLTMIDILTHSARPGVMRLALNYLDDPHAPLAALNVLSHRTDEQFVRHLLAKIGFEAAPPVKANLKRVELVTWIRDQLPLVDKFNDALQHSAVQLAVCTSLHRPLVFKLLERLLERGTVGGRRAASAALAGISGHDANQLALKSLADADPQVRANLLGQLRERGIPGAMTRLIEAIESDEPLVRDAARRSLEEFSFKRYLAAFDLLEPEVRKSTGALVRRVDPHVLENLSQEFLAPARSRRLRAIEITSALGLSREMEESLISLLQDEDHFVRVEAAITLAQCDSEPSRNALREALLDRSVSVQEAAENSLRKLHGHERSAVPAPALTSELVAPVMSHSQEAFP